MGYKYFSWFFMKLAALFDWDNLAGLDICPPRESGADSPSWYFHFYYDQSFEVVAPLYCTSTQQFVCGVVSDFMKD